MSTRATNGDEDVTLDVFLCSQCGRSQTYAPADVPGGVTKDEAIAIGWTRGDAGGWLCPFCSPDPAP